MVRCNNPQCSDEMCMRPYPEDPNYEDARRIRTEYMAREKIGYALFWMEMKKELENKLGSNKD